MINPILEGWHPDPSIVRVDDDYYLAVSSFEFTPGVPIYHSKDLVHWTLINHALPNIEIRTPEPGAGIWAPTLRYRKDEGLFYLVTCKFDRYRPLQGERVFPRGFYVTSRNIWDTKAWSSPKYFDEIGFDQDIFWDDDTSTAYLSTTRALTGANLDPNKKNFAIHICKVDPNSGSSLGPTKVLLTSQTGIAEGSHIIKRDGWYYLFAAEGGTDAGHSETVYRSRHVDHSYEAFGSPILKNAAWHDVQNTGHADFFTDPNGDWWCVFLGTRAKPSSSASDGNRSILGRETFLSRVDWIDDWPVVNEGKPIQESRGSVNRNPLLFDSVLGGNGLSLGWYSKCTPQRAFYAVQQETVTIHGGPYDLSSAESPSALFRKQTSFEMSFSATVSFRAEDKSEEAGICIYLNSYSYISLGISYGKLCLSKGPSVGPVDGLNDLMAPELETTRLTIKATRDLYTIFCQSSDEEAPRCVCSFAPASLLNQPPVGFIFSGAMVGIYSSSKSGAAVANPALFRDIKMSL